MPEQPASAFVYVASIGYHELYVNGEKVDSRVLSPPLTNINKRVLYVAYDISGQLKPGRNCLAIWTAAGWSRFSAFKSKSALRVQLMARTAGGQTISLATDANWRCQISPSCDLGGRRFNDNGGEQFDARRNDPKWSATDYDDAGWASAVPTAINVELSAQMVEPSRVIEDIPAQSVSSAGAAYKIVLIKNFSGWVSVVMRHQAPGDVITIQTSDNPKTVQAFGQKSVYICSGGVETFQNRFNYAAGRYITLTGLKAEPDLSDVVGHAIGTDLNRVGHFSCSSELLNHIYETDLWTYRADTVEGYTQDCPQRERLGYGEENFATAWGCGLPNYQVGAYYVNDLRNWRDVQQPNGWINFVAPQINKPWGGPMWSSALLNVSLEFYKTYGDKRVLADNYSANKAWVDFLGSQIKDGILSAYDKGGAFLGDWARPTDAGDPLKGKEFGNTRESLFFNNCVYAMDLRSFVEEAQALGKTDDAADYQQKLLDLRANINSQFFDADRKCYIDTRQVHLAFPLFAGITPVEARPAVLANFEKEILLTRPYLDMGSSGLPILLKFLVEDAKRDDILCELLGKTTEPSYGFFLSRGETTWPEYWDDNCSSRIHTCYTGIAAWFIKGLGGIREDPDHYGYQSFIIQPSIVGDLTYAEARTDSLYGTIVSRWEKRDGHLQMTLSIPANSSALVYVPATDIKNIMESGTTITRARGVTFLRMEAPYAVFRVQSGQYQISSVLR